MGKIQMKKVRNSNSQQKESWKGETKLGEIVDKFQNSNRARGLSNATIRGYDQCIRSKFLKWASENNVKRGQDIDQSIIDDYLVYLRSEDITDTTVSMYVRHLRSFINYGIKHGYINPTIEVPTIQTQEKTPETYSQDELKALLKKPDLDTCTFQEYRNWVIINFLLGTGARLGSVQALKIKDIDFEDGMIELNTTKQKKAQRIPISQSLKETLREYLKVRNGELEDPLFCKDDGEALSKEGLSTAIQRYNKRRGVDKTSIHLFRHTFAKEAVKNGIDPLRLQKILGHSTLKMTKHYVNLFGTDLKDGFDDYNPLDNLTK